MNIRLVSDVHTEFHGDGGMAWVAKQDPTGVDVLVVAGDLGTLVTIPAVLTGLCRVYPHVVYVNGNHELYGSSFVACENARKELLASLPNLHWLQNSSVTIEGQRFIGATMWFRDNPMNFFYKNMLNDFRRIQSFERRVYDENRRAVRYLQDQIVPGDVVVTHHLPSELSVPDQYKGSPTSRFYVCHMEATIELRRPALWCHGHTHASNDYTLYGTRVLSNPYGYQGHELNPEYDGAQLVTL